MNIETIICGTREEIDNYLDINFNFKKRTIDISSNINEDINFDGYSETETIKKQLDEFKAPASVICWFKQHKIDSTKEPQEIKITMERQWIFIREQKV